MAKHHNFKSFKERVNALKIRPYSKLGVRSYEDTTTSFYLETLAHWKEVNISGNFTSCVERIEPFSRSLAQVLHHKNQLYDILEYHISQHDIHSLQPLLEILTQFIHDLGPEFLTFYKRFIHLLMDLCLSVSPNDSQSMKNSANILEWCFNSLAFAFRYLSPDICEDLWNSFEDLIPLLKEQKKAYIGRFCAEAMSHLIKKLSKEAYLDFVDRCFTLISETDLTLEFLENIAVIFTEAIKVANDNLHSKTLMILKPLLNKAMRSCKENDYGFLHLTARVIMCTLHHAKNDQACSMSRKILIELNTYLPLISAPRQLHSILFLYLAIIFTDNGRKVSLDQDFVQFMKAIGLKYAEDDEPEAQFATCSTMFALLWTLLVRNLEANTAAMLLLQLWDTLPSTFSVLQLSVLEIVKDLKHEAPLSLEIDRRFQQVINGLDLESGLQQLSLIISRSEIDESHDLLKLAIPITLKDNILDLIATAVKDEKSELNDIKWRCNILRLQSVKSADDQKVALKLINSINQRWDTPDTSELNGQLISFFVNCPEGDDTIPLAKDLTDMLPSLINVCCKSEVFLSAVQNFYKFFGGPSFAAPLQAACLGNLSSTNRRLRLESIQTLQILCPEHKDILSQMTSVDQIALEVENASLMRLRILELFKAYSMHLGTSLIQIGMAHFIMGLLCKQYQPCWEAVFDALKSMADSALDDLLSRLLYDQLLAKPSIERPLKFDEEEANQGSDFWILENDDGIFKSLFKKVNDRVPHSTKELVTRINKMGVVEEVSDQITSQMRNRFLKCLKEVPKIALADVDRSLELIHCVVYDESENSWSMEEKVTALELVSSIKGRISRCLRITLSSTLREAIGSKHSKLQEAALKAYLALDTSLLRYRDELMNLLDDKLFKDEVLSLLGETSDERVKEEDEKTVIPLILQLFFGKMQTSSKKSKKFGARFTIASILPSLKPQYVTHFVSHMSSKIPFQTYFAAASSPEDYFDNIKIMTGFVNMLSEVYDALGYKYYDVLKETIQPLAYVLICVQKIASSETEGNSSPLKSLRQTSFRCLNTFDKLVGSQYDWSLLMPILFEHVLRPRLTNFQAENNQLVSSLLEFTLNRVNHDFFMGFYSLDDWMPLKAITSLMSNEHCKDEVIISLMDFFISALTKQVNREDLQYIKFLAMLVDSLLSNLPRILESSKNRDVLSRCATLLLLLVEGQFLSQEYDKTMFIHASCKALQKSSFFVRSEDKVSLLISIALMMESMACDEKVEYELTLMSSKMLRFSKDSRIRKSITKVFDAYSILRPDFRKTVEILDHLNASQSQSGDYDFSRILDGFDLIDETFFTHSSLMGWKLALSSCLFFMDNEDESVLRSNATHAIKKFAEFHSRAETDSNKTAFREVFDELINPAICHGLLNPTDDVRSSYIEVLADLARFKDLLPQLQDLGCLLSEDDSEDFFLNVRHIQVTARQRAIRELVAKRDSLTEFTAKQYILPLLENYLFCKEEKSRNLCDDAQGSFAALSCVLPWSVYVRYLKKYITIASAQTDQMRDAIKVVIHLINNMSVIRKEHLQNGSKFLQGFPQHDEEFNNFVVNLVVQPIRKTLSIRNDSTICMRLPLLEACVVALLMTPSQIVLSELPGILISTCQVLRSKSQELRDHARKALCKASNHLGATYLRYLLRELRGALSRGSQIHVLSYTLNSILREVCCTAKYGDIDESARIVVDIVMEDVFGAAGKEKDAEGYHSKMIEVKAKKSFDTIELLCSKLSFDAFDSILDPMKELLDQALPSKTERAIEECFRRICLGILANERADSTDVLLLCYKIHKSSLDVKSANQCKTPKRDESHFLVDINSKSRMNNANEFQRSQYLQRLSFEILRSVIGKHRQLLSVANIDGFIPLLSTSLNSSNEPLVATVLRVVVLLIKLEFPPSRDDVFEGICEKAIEIVLESQSTAEELSQLSLKYIATVVKHWKSECCSKEAICALLLKITPDLEDPEKQSSAFNFVKAVITRRIQIPEVYDVMDKILRIMVVNHFQEIRDIARGLYFKFMLLYDQGQKRMEASFKFLMDNLKYPTPSGRQSVMELMHSILLKSNTSIVDKNASSFFVGLANLMVSDEQEKCREMATILLGQLLEKASPDKLKVFEHLIDTWLHNQDKNVLRRCGLLSYKCYISKFGMERNEILNSSASEVIELFLLFAQTLNSSEGRWEDIFSALNVLSHIIGITSKNYWEKKTKFWDLVCQCLLYPHSWIRLLSSKLLGTYVDWATESSSDKNNEFLQLVSHRSIRQLAAPGLPDSLGKASVHNILKIFSFFEDNDVLYVSDTSMTDANDREKFQHNFAADIISDRINYLLRRCVSSEFGLSSRKAILTLTTTLIGKLTGERLQNFVQQVITTLLGVDEYLFAEDTMFQEYSRECFRIAEKNLGTKLYSKVFATAKAEISTRRAKRKAERAQLMLDNPTKASEKKMKKHARFREKRKDNKDENGYYKQKRRKV